MMIVHPPSTRRVPLRNIRGEVVAHALVDNDDYARVMEVGRWHLNSDGYPVHSQRAPGGKQYTIQLHRFVMRFGTGDPEIDHKDTNPLNNKKSNLRPCAHSQNLQNRKQRITGTSKYRGVHWKTRDKRWYAKARLNYKYVHIGCFVTEEEAHEAISAWRAKHMPFSAEGGS